VPTCSQLGTKKKHKLTMTSRYAGSSGADAEQERQQFCSHTSAHCHSELSPPLLFLKT